jgi:hypothetical protein
VRQHPNEDLATLRPRAMGREGGAEPVLQAGEDTLNGLFANDSFCLTRSGRLRLAATFATVEARRDAYYLGLGAMARLLDRISQRWRRGR